MPRILPIRPIGAWLREQNTVTSYGWRVLLSPRADSGFDSLPREAPPEPGVLLFGPEGGLAPQEETLAREAGFTAITNVTHGFEGDLDAHRHRNSVNGWRFDGLPWEQY